MFVRYGADGDVDYDSNRTPMRAPICTEITRKNLLLAQNGVRARFCRFPQAERNISHSF